MEKLLIFGSNTTARSIYKFVTDYHLYEIIGFAVDAKYKTIDTYCNLPVYDFDNLPSSFDKDRDFVFIAMEWDKLNSVRRSVYERIKKMGFKMANIISPNAIIHGSILGDNCWICDNVVLENDVEIYENVMIKTGAIVAHLSIVEKHSFIGARSFLAGDVHVGEQTYIGVGSIIFNSVNIGKKCIVGAAVYVKRHLPDYSLIKTPNDEFVIKTYDEFEIENKLVASIKIR